ncbi:hypothetical protein CS542_03470 [Pedobacter sp. IW39]|nr:hypothetical protein CS542_03470 [Pedobacter sp. IW39]
MAHHRKKHSFASLNFKACSFASIISFSICLRCVMSEIRSICRSTFPLLLIIGVGDRQPDRRSVFLLCQHFYRIRLVVLAFIAELDMSS